MNHTRIGLLAALLLLALLFSLTGCSRDLQFENVDGDVPELQADVDLVECRMFARGLVYGGYTVAPGAGSAPQGFGQGFCPGGREYRQHGAAHAVREVPPRAKARAHYVHADARLRGRLRGA